MGFFSGLLSKLNGQSKPAPKEVVKPTPTPVTPSPVVEVAKPTLPKEPVVVPKPEPEPEPAEAISISDERRFTKRGIIEGVITVEKGYVNHPSDLGGETNFGITVGVANGRAVKKRLTEMGWDGKMRNLTYEMAYNVYEIEYWDKLHLDAIFEISPHIADKLFDQGVNCGVGRAAKWFQRSLKSFNRRGRDYPDITVDGKIGKATTDALKAFIAKRGKVGAVNNTLRAIISLQGAHYITISEDREENEDFTYGWFDSRLPHNVVYYFPKK